MAIGEKTRILSEKDKGISGGIATLDASKQIPYEQTPHLIGNKSIYVDSKIGTDENTGIESAPLRTIQAAIDRLPKDLSNFGVSIYVSDGVYDEDVIICGFYGGRDYDSIKIIGSTTMDDTRKVRSFSIVNTGCVITLQGMCVTGSNSGIAVSVFGAKASILDFHMKSGGDGDTIGVAIGTWSPAQASFLRCVVEGYSSKGFLVDRASVADIDKTTVKNCEIGIQVGGGASGTTGIAILGNMTYEGNARNTAKINGGQIFEEAPIYGWCAMGDSLTSPRTLTGENYVDFVSKSLEILVTTNVALGGSGYIAQNIGGQTFMDQIEFIPYSTNVVTIMGSVNDRKSKTGYTLGNLGDTSGDTLYGAFQQVLDAIHVRVPNTPVGIIAPPPSMYTSRRTDADDSIEYVDALKNFCAYNSIPFLNLFDESGMRPWESKFVQENYLNGDGVHPTTEAHKRYIAPKVEAFIRGLLW